MGTCQNVELNISKTLNSGSWNRNCTPYNIRIPRCRKHVAGTTLTGPVYRGHLARMMLQGIHCRNHMLQEPYVAGTTNEGTTREEPRVAGDHVLHQTTCCRGHVAGACTKLFSLLCHTQILFTCDGVTGLLVDIWV